MDLRRLVAIGFTAALGWWSPTPAVDGAGRGELHATVALEGPVPAPEALTLDHPKEQHALKECGGEVRYSERLVVDPSGGISSAVAWLEEPSLPSEPMEPATAVLDQEACAFLPHVLVIPLGGALAIRNSDPVLHNVRIFREGTMLMHEWQQPNAADLTWTFTEPGRFLVRCGVHPWMYAWVIVADHRYFGVTDATGHVIISQVPESPYTLHVWHETLGEVRQRVTIGARPTAVTVRMARHTNDGRSP